MVANLYGLLLRLATKARVRGCSPRYMSGHISGAQLKRNRQYWARQGG
jgi:hypothetical protein